MSANEIHQNDIGTVFKATVKDGGVAVDVSSASELYMIFVKPTGTKLTKTASLYNDGTDGIIKYATLSGDLDTIGTWKVQGKIIDGGNTWYSDIKTFKVHRNL